MIITFCGHADFQKNKEYEEKIFEILDKEISGEAAEIYLGGYGQFDDFAYFCCKKYKERHPSVSLVFVSPYMTLDYQKKYLEYQKERYDEIIYPPIEDKPLKFAISYRNKYMVEKADVIVAFVERKSGGAYQTYICAKRKGKIIYNLAQK